MRRYGLFCCGMMFLSFFPLGARYLDWGYKTFLQVDKENFAVEDARTYIQSKSVYDTFKTVIHVDALWFNRDVADFYNTVAKSRFRDARKISSDDLVFYVLVAPSDDAHVVSYFDDGWSVYIKAGDKTYATRDKKIEKITELDPIDRYIFGDKYKKKLRFKTIYRLEFDASCIKNAGEDWTLVFAKDTFVVPISWYKTGRCS